MTLISIFKDFSGLLFPRTCLACERALHKKETHLCLHCTEGLPRFVDAETLAQKFWGRLPLLESHVFLAYQKKGRAQSLLHAIKYGGQGDAAAYIGRLWGAELKKAGAFADHQAVTPIPLHPSKLKKRGYNQSLLFAQGLADALGLVCLPEALGRGKASVSQTTKKKFERWQNVSGDFYLKDGSALSGKKVILADDVITTGATMESCGNLLLQGGAAGLSLAGIASAD